MSLATIGEISANACWFEPNVLLKSIKSEVFDLAWGYTYLESICGDLGGVPCLNTVADPLGLGDSPSSSTSSITTRLSIELIPDFIETGPDFIETGLSRSLLIVGDDFFRLPFWPFNSDSVIVFST